MKLLAKLKRALAEKSRSFREHLINSLCFVVYQKKPLRERVALVESRSGEDFASNIFYLAQELNRRNITVYVSFKPGCEDRLRRIAGNGCFSDLHFVRLWSRRYYRLLVTAKYLFNDVCFDWKWIKREGQAQKNPALIKSSVED